MYICLYRFVTAVNDNESFQSHSSHWSSLLCHIPTGNIWHYDSYKNKNTKSAQNLVEKLTKVFQWNTVPIIHNIKGPQQTNGYDCGVFTVLFMKRLSTLLVQYPIELLSSTISLEHVNALFVDGKIR